jgi:hypothetical protein
MAQTKLTQVYADIDLLRETWAFPEAIAGGIAVVQEGRAAVTLAGTPGQTKSVTVAGMTLSGIPLGDNGQGALKSTVHTTGTFEGPITGASIATLQNERVYMDPTDELTMSADDGSGTDYDYFGRINLPEGYVVSGTVLPIKIGVPA